MTIIVQMAWAVADVAPVALFTVSPVLVAMATSTKAKRKLNANLERWGF